MININEIKRNYAAKSHFRAFPIDVVTEFVPKNFSSVIRNPMLYYVPEAKPLIER